MEQGFIFIRQSFGAATGEHVERKMPFFFFFLLCQCYIPPRGCNVEAGFSILKMQFLTTVTGVTSPIRSQRQPVSLSGLHQKHNGVLHGECGHMLSGLNQQAEGKR